MKSWLLRSALLVFIAVLLAGGAALAQSANSTSTRLGTGYSLHWWTVDGGGTTSSGNSGYSLGDTIGQPDAAVWSGGDYVLAGGFWGGVAIGYRIFLPLVMRSA